MPAAAAPPAAIPSSRGQSVDRRSLRRPAFAFSSPQPEHTDDGPTRTQAAWQGRRTTVRVVDASSSESSVAASTQASPTDLTCWTAPRATRLPPSRTHRSRFPRWIATAIPPRTATFTVERRQRRRLDDRYEMTHDFETGVSRMLVDRATSPDIEVLAVFDTPTCARSISRDWWSMPRGEFPLVGGSERQRWLRTIDEYFPAAMRPSSRSITRPRQSSVPRRCGISS